MDIYELKPVQCFMDLKNFFKFRKMIKKEKKNFYSKFNQYKLQQNWLGNIVYVQINCTDTDLRNADFDSERMLAIKLKPIVDYLGSELEWSDYLVPQISNFVDNEGNPSLSFGVLFIFTGYSLTMTKAFVGLLATLGILGAGIYALFRWL